MNLFVTGGWDNRLKVWDNKYKCMKTMENHTGIIEALIQLRSDKSVMISDDCDRNIMFWNVLNEFKLLHPIKRDDCSKEKVILFMLLFELKTIRVLVSTLFITK